MDSVSRITLMMLGMALTGCAPKATYDNPCDPLLRSCAGVPGDLCYRDEQCKAMPNGRCVESACVCVPNCDGRECGSDGCGGTCGTCGCGEECQDLQCVFVACRDRECGLDICGNSCGECWWSPTLCGSTGACSEPFQMPPDGDLAANLNDLGDGTVADTVTGLVWQKEFLSNVDWQFASSACLDNMAGLPGAGWRLPTIIELQGIVDYGTWRPAQSGPFETSQEVFWSGTPCAWSAASAWYVAFYGGHVSFETMTTPHAARCVRSETTGEESR